MKTKPPTMEEIKDIVFTPNDSVRYAIDTIEERRKSKGVGVRTGIPVVDEYFNPARPGELIPILGMSSNFKTGLMQFWGRHVAKNEIQSNGIEDQCVIYVTWEQAIEEILAFDLAAVARLNANDIMQGKVSDEEMERLRMVHSPRRAVVPIFLIGHSLREGKKRPDLTLTTVGQAMQFIRTEFGMKPRVIFLDYLQQMVKEQDEANSRDNRRMEVFDHVRRCKNMALAMACPVVVGVQVDRKLYHETWGVPNMADGLETSNIEHTADKMIGVWMPKTTFDDGKMVDIKGMVLKVSENLLILRVLKQRMGPAGKWWPLHVMPGTNQIMPMDVHHTDLNGEE